MASATMRPFSGGTKLRWFAGAPGDITTDPAWLDFAGIVGIGAMNTQTDDVETTELDPYIDIAEDAPEYPAIPYFIKTFEGGFTDLGELPLEVNFTSGQYVMALEAQFTRWSFSFQMQFRNGYTVSFSGYVKGIGLDAKQSDLVKMPVTIKLDGAISIGLTPAS